MAPTRSPVLFLVRIDKYPGKTGITSFVVYTLVVPLLRRGYSECPELLSKGSRSPVCTKAPNFTALF